MDGEMLSAINEDDEVSLSAAVEFLVKNKVEINFARFVACIERKLKQWFIFPKTSKVLTYLMSSTIYKYPTAELLRTAFHHTDIFLIDQMIIHGLQIDKIGDNYADVGNLFVDACKRKTKYVFLHRLILRGFDINVQSTSGATGISRAASTGTIPVLRMLMSNEKCDIDKEDNNGNTPIMVASRYNKLKSLKLLLTQKDKIKLSSQAGALRMAIRHERKEVMKTLLKAGFSVQNAVFVKSSSINETAKLYFAAGGMISSGEESMTLEDLCRGQIRKTLLEANTSSNLFIEVPKLPLPTLLKTYLCNDIIL